MSSLSENNNSFVHYQTNLSPDMLSSDNKPNINTELTTTNVKQVWTKTKFININNQKQDFDNIPKMSWSDAIIRPIVEDPAPSPPSPVQTQKPVEVKQEPLEDLAPEITTPADQTALPSHHARRPMNAFLIFCKKHRPIVRKKYQNLENRGVTRILGEWWALLDQNDKDPYTNLAKEYKDAFFCANPNFKWYKLPAPPLRTLSTRPANIKQEMSPLPSPTLISPPSADFTPGKLADESQLGMLSCLLNSQTYTNKVNEIKNVIITDQQNNNNQNAEKNNNKEDFETLLQSPVNFIDNASLPPKPIKKRIYDSLADNKNITRNIFETNNTLLDKEQYMTNQEIVNKIVENKFSDNDNEVDSDQETLIKNGKVRNKDTRKSGRKCKGKLYAEFMVNGKLLKNKRDRPDKFINNNSETPKLDLDSTIKRLEERVMPKSGEDVVKKDERTRTSSEMSEGDDLRTIPSFNLDERIAALSSLSYDSYVQRKRDSKKRKLTVRSKTENNKQIKLDVQNHLVGSKKRKNKHNITHLEKNDFGTHNDLSGLDTLAEIAANTAKINDNA